MNTFSQGLIFSPNQAKQAGCSLKNERLIIKLLWIFQSLQCDPLGLAMDKHLHCFLLSLLSCTQKKSVYRELFSKALTIDLALIISLTWSFLKLESVLIEGDNSSSGYRTQSSCQTNTCQPHILSPSQDSFSQGQEKFFPLPQVDYTCNYPAKQEIGFLAISKRAKN